MKTLVLNSQTITNTFNNQVFNTYNEALEFGVTELGWDENEVLERQETIQLEVNKEIEAQELNCLMVDSGSEDYVYFIQW